MCLTAHFTDDDWKLHKKILNFCPIASHKGLLIGKAIERCLLDWGISKVFTITVDNASSNDIGIKYLQNRLESWKGSVLSGDFLHMRCCAHILSLTVKEGLKDMEDSIFRIRSTVRYVRSSLKAFELLEIQDVKYKDELTRGEKSRGLPMPSDWEYARYLLPFLKVFYDATLQVSSSLLVTDNAYMREIFAIGMQISTWSRMVLDHRFKLGYVNWVISKSYDDTNAELLKIKVHTTLYSLFDQYKLIYSSPSGQSSQQSQQASQVNVEDVNVDPKELMYCMYDEAMAGQEVTVTKSEMDKYLEDEYE
ncbi:zinc finger BED domain-containing protein RICESLEEPER 1-like [Pistacia vera]|uniref:zinc finger BED domain-containing protein RICESLEEPER 1-like n=1 Tax=Pistacia vera TaxID=55513 RepID=UPI001262D1D2|nr:zinc finger BED domain-containing protein RICESLEEPER 1-like [Pistacia vera]